MDYGKKCFENQEMFINVPKFKQRKNTCGTTSLRMVLSFWGRDIPEKEIIREVGGLKSYGVKTTKLADFAGKLGFNISCFSYNRKLADGGAKLKLPDTKDIITFLKRGVPVIVNIRYSLLHRLPLTKAGHFIVITGYRGEKDAFRYNDPEDGKSHTIGAEHLRFAWFNNVPDSSAYFLAIWPKKL